MLKLISFLFYNVKTKATLRLSSLKQPGCKNSVQEKFPSWPFADCDGGSQNVFQMTLLTPQLALACIIPELSGTTLYSVGQLIICTVLVSCYISFHFLWVWRTLRLFSGMHYLVVIVWPENNSFIFIHSHKKRLSGDQICHFLIKICSHLHVSDF